LVIVSMVFCKSSACFSMSAERSGVVLLVERLRRALHADLERDRGVLERLAVGPGDRLHPADALDADHGLRDLVDHQEVRGVAQVAVALDQQQFGVHPGGVEVPFGRGVALRWQACRSGR
jgi:hypothetical protein